MEDKTQETTQLLVEDQVRRGYAVVPVPESIRDLLQEAHDEDPSIPVWPAVRFNKYTHKIRRDIALVAQRQLNADLQDKSLLSTTQLMKLTEERGEWTQDHQDRLTELQERTGELMREVSPQGETHMAWARELADRYDEIVKQLEPQRADLVPVFERWANYDASRLNQYTILYAAEQGTEVYDREVDFRTLCEQVPMEMLDAVQEVDALTERMQAYLLLLELQDELRTLFMKRQRLFAESIENRREMTESLERVRRLAQWADLEGEQKGAITNPELLPEPVLDWLLTECQLFLQGVPPEAREHLQNWGFLPAPRERGSSASSDASPVEPSSSSDSAA